LLLTTSDLVTAVRRKGQIPDASDYTDAEILAEADDVISGRLTEVIAGLSNGFYVRYLDITMVAATARYALPTRSVADTVEHVAVLQSDGTERPLSRLRNSDAMYVTGSSGTPYNYTIEGADLLLYPAPTTAETIRVRYQIRRAKLTSIGTNAFAITAANYGARTVSFVGTVPTTWTTYSTMTTKLDLIGREAGSVYLDVDRVVTSYTQGSPSTVGSSATALPATMLIGDYVTVAGYTPVVQLPDELHAALANATAAAILGQRGFTQGMQTLDAFAARDIEAYSRMAAQRVKNAPVTFVNRNSMLRLRGR